MGIGGDPTSDLRVRGAAIAFGLWLPFAAPMVGMGGVNLSSAVALAVIGMLVAPAAAWRLAPRALVGGGLGASTAITFAVQTVVAGAFLYGLFLSVTSGQGLHTAIATGAVALIVMGIPMLILGTKLALLWVAIVRRYGRPARAT